MWSGSKWNQTRSKQIKKHIYSLTFQTLMVSMCVRMGKGARTQSFRTMLIFLGWVDAARKRCQGQYNLFAKDIMNSPQCLCIYASKRVYVVFVFLMQKILFSKETVWRHLAMLGSKGATNNEQSWTRHRSKLECAPTGQSCENVSIKKLMTVVDWNTLNP